MCRFRNFFAFRNRHHVLLFECSLDGSRPFKSKHYMVRAVSIGGRGDNWGHQRNVMLMRCESFRCQTFGSPTSIHRITLFHRSGPQKWSLSLSLSLRFGGRPSKKEKGQAGLSLRDLSGCRLDRLEDPKAPWRERPNSGHEQVKPTSVLGNSSVKNHGGFILDIHHRS